MSSDFAVTTVIFVAIGIFVVVRLVRGPRAVSQEKSPCNPRVQKIKNVALWIIIILLVLTLISLVQIPERAPPQRSSFQRVHHSERGGLLTRERLSTFIGSSSGTSARASSRRVLT